MNEELETQIKFRYLNPNGKRSLTKQNNNNNNNYYYYYYYYRSEGFIIFAMCTLV